MNTDSQGGEPSCFLSELDDQGNVPDPRELVRLEDADAVKGEGAWRVLVSMRPPQREGYNQWVAELAPAAGETLAVYRARLEGPACRTAAWQIALKAQDEAVRITVADAEGTDVRPHAEALVTYIRELLT